jgi:NCAIR mutase (PurE)-related protein
MLVWSRGASLRRAVFRKRSHRFCASGRQFSTNSCELGNETSIKDILNQVSDGRLRPSEAETMILHHRSKDTKMQPESPEEVLNSFANLDHSRPSRTGFPEAVFGSGKTPDQITRIIDDMARNFNDMVSSGKLRTVTSSQRAILATR